MAALKLAYDRSGSGVLASDSQSRDIQIQSYSLSFHGRLLIENADFSLNYGQRYANISPLNLLLQKSIWSSLSALTS